ncbi:MAG: HAMP domain-containing histidine kinase [Eggerthellaceae bacterium]|nr:HAMP domain-containing histidine kinase [Eggerthellaceae bacterium]MDR2721775.1 HAMP domain-containing histidine kinase [Coriobacteriaceae bacterium]
MLLLLIPAALIVLVLSLVGGHFFTEPLRVLERATRAFIDSNSPMHFPAKGQLHEADQLAKNFEELAEVAKVQQTNWVVKENRRTAFVSDVAHELRTPLTAIHGNAEMLLDPDLPPELHDKFCTIIINESERLGRLTNDLLTLQQIENDVLPTRLERINLHDLAREVLDILAPTLHERKANAQIVGAAPDVLGSADRLKQVISNLVDNASRFTPPDGHITIELFGMKGKSIITVKDDGEGFGDTDPRLLFDRFYRTDASRSRNTGGAGLGLPIVKSIVEAHDGTVEAFNLPEGGACFIVALPALRT